MAFLYNLGFETGGPSLQKFVSSDFTKQESEILLYLQYIKKSISHCDKMVNGLYLYSALSSQENPKALHTFTR